MKRRKVAKELQETVQTVQRAEGEGAEACEPPSGRAKKKAKPTKAKRAGKVKTTPPKSTKDAAEAFWPEVIQVLDDLADPNARGTLSDRLNPSHPRFDKKLKASWKGFSKKERAAIVDCDQKKMKATVSATVSIEHPFDVNDDDHCETSLEAYRDVAEAAMAELDGHMCWPVEWFKEDLPIEKTINRSYHVPKMMDPYVKAQSQELLEIPKPDAPAKMNILVFADMLGYSKNLLANAPEGRISMKKVVENYHSLTQEDVKRLVTEPKKGWDLVIFAVGCDPPRSNSIEDIIEQNTVISRLYFWLSYEIQRAEGSARKIFCLVRGLFHEDKRTHMKAGLGITVCGTLFGMTNTLRQELEGVDLHFCDTEYFMEEDSPLWASVAAEAFRDTTFGMIDVRILESGRYVQKRVSSKVYQAANKEFPLPNSGVICISGGNGALGLVMGNWLLDKAAEQGKSGFQIQFLSRSMKISDLNMPLWKDIEAKAAKLGVRVEQGKMDMSSKEGCCNFIEKLNGELYGFIHSAGVLQDSMLMNLTWEKFETVYQSKHHAALFLHYALENNPQKNFQFMWNFSSTSVYGNMGQLNYSGSNSFLDVLTRHRKAKGKPSLAIQWGAWGDVGMAATMTDAMRLRTMNSPMPYFSNKEGLYGLECGLATGLAYFSVFKFNPPVMMGSVQYADVVPSCHHRNHYSEVLKSCELSLVKTPSLSWGKIEGLIGLAGLWSDWASLLSRLDEDEEHVEYSQAILVLGKLLLQSFSLILHTTLQGKSPKKLRIYDPFFCAGSVVKHLAELGFPKVYNKCEETTGIQGTRALALGHLHCFVTKVWLAKDSTSELDGRRVTRS
ncbi:6-methylsalicylic acid synthase (6-MSAS) (Arthrosporol biosynthesis cluster protein AOL_s00215g283) [Durusdinium trenchii]|uniref:6-methylsalicylic acid synthase (6-MSAS) (Arthrosporol biosynthesis cluster protein AOL_s00215g283) n=1 Tax=Durusdinium trenchii TaxID=1381693 RepID=A0ABP0R539_9DINO